MGSQLRCCWLGRCTVRPFSSRRLTFGSFHSPRAPETFTTSRTASNTRPQTGSSPDASSYANQMAHFDMAGGCDNFASEHLATL